MRRNARVSRWLGRVRVTPAAVLALLALVLASVGGAYASATGGTTALWAVVAENGHLLRGHGATRVTPQGGIYAVTFDRDVSKCAWEATIGTGKPGYTPAPGFIGVAPTLAHPHAVTVQTTDQSGVVTPFAFHLLVSC